MGSDAICVENVQPDLNDSITEYNCMICSSKYYDEYDFNNDMKCHRNKLCPVCSLLFTDVTDLKHHLNIHQEDNKEYKINDEHSKVSLEDIQKDIKEAKDEVLNTIKLIYKQKEQQNNTNDTETSNNDDFENVAYKARSIEEIVAAYPECKLYK